MRILLADDDEDVRHLVSHHLRKAGHEIVVVDSGEKALMRLEEFPLRLDAVITDQNMSPVGLKGLDVLRSIRDGSPYAAMPVIVHSSDDSEAFANEVASLGGTFVHKTRGSPARILALLAELTK